MLAFLAVACTLFGRLLGTPLPPVPPKDRWDSPCLAIDTEDPVNPRGILNMTTDIMSRTDEIKMLSRDLKNYNIEEYNYIRPVRDYLDLQNFIDSDEYTITADKLTSAVANPIEAAQSHYSLMYALVSYVERCRTEGKVKEMTGADSLKAQLKYVETKMYDVICSLKIALRGEGASTDHSVTPDVLSPTFLGLNKTLVNETYRAYVVMNDSEGVMSYLKEIYATIQSSNS